MSRNQSEMIWACDGALSCWKEDGHTVVIKGWTCNGQQQYSGRLWRLNNAQLVQKKISPTPLHHHHQPEPLRTRQDGSMLSCSLRQTLTRPSECAAEIETHQTRQRFLQSSIVRFWWTCVNCSLRFLFLSDRSGTRCGLLLLEAPSASGFDVLCVSEMVFCIPWLVTSGYLSYCCLSIISIQSVHSPLNSDINKAFSSTQLPLTGYFLFVWPFSVNLEMVVCENPSRSAVSEILRPARLAPIIIICSKSLKSPFFPFWCSVWTSASRLHHI